MPTYEYECEKCGHRFEKFQQMSDEPLKTCPECRGKVRRLIGAGAAVISKGSSSHRGDTPDCGQSCPYYGRDMPCDTRPCER